MPATIVAVPMRTDCKYYESRTYAHGETVRKCHLDLAPEAPWRCPENCPAFAPRLASVGWSYGTAVSPPTPEDPRAFDGVAELLDHAEDILNEAGPRLLAEVQAERESEGRPFWRRLFDRGRGRGRGKRRPG